MFWDYNAGHIRFHSTGIIMVPIPRLANIIRHEFAHYSLLLLRKDVLAGLAVAAVSLPLALAYGIAGGMSPAAGLVTAIIAGIVTGILGGTAYQISGPTGAMSAVLLVILHRTGVMGMWGATLIGGVLLILMGVFRFGRYVVFIPTPVITGFTIGIALIIAVSQIDPSLGLHTAPADTALLKLLGYITPNATSSLNVAALGVTVATIGLLWGFRRFVPTVPDTLGTMAVITAIVWMAHIPVDMIGDLPPSIVLNTHLDAMAIPWASFNDMFGAGISIAALAAIESLMTGTAGSAMSGKGFDADQELIAQGSANLVVPWFGGVPSSAAISRTAVAIRTGAVTRLASITHAGVLIVVVLFAGTIIGHIPMACLAGVLLWTAWHMCDWPTITRYLHSRVRHAIVGMVVTVLATVALDLTQAIVIGLAVSAIIHLRLEVQSAHVNVVPVDPTRLRDSTLTQACAGIRVAYVSGSMFFGNAATMRHMLSNEEHCHTLIISMRGVPMIDVMGAELLRSLIHEFRARHGDILLAGVQPAVLGMLHRLGIIALLGEDNLYWDAAAAIHVAHERIFANGCAYCGADCQALSPSTMSDSGDTSTHLHGG